jgi:hypothetical protein
MSTIRRVLPLALFAFGTLGFAIENLSAQQQPTTSGSTALIPISGVADGGGTFTGTVLVQRFEADGNAVRAIGTASGALVDGTGISRNVVTQIALPLDINASIARRASDPVVALAPCDTLHLEFGVATVNVLGSTVGLNGSAVDIVAGVQPGATPTATTGQTNTPQLDTSFSTQPGFPSGSPAASSFTAQPGFTAAPQQQATATSSSSRQLSVLLCSTNLRNAAASPGQFATLLNQVLTALR